MSMSFHWYRSRVFWFGCIGLVMLLIAWLSFPQSHLELTYTPESDSGLTYITYSVSKELGNVEFVRWKNFPRNSPVIQETGWRVLNRPLGKVEVQDLFGKIWFAYDDDSGFGVANWFIVAVYIILWLGGLVLWQRRKKRLMNSRILRDES
ncbi:MAG: hypothetical protein EOP88_20740 [Verrucomicrobiaceae bacterium]|nr:MAG: hypothetical protein EOP88_20740 [Verrucomicrobiaceae bacterium]